MENEHSDCSIGCAAARDLLPLYADGVASGESAALVETHLAACPACQAEFSRLQQRTPAKQENPKRTLMRVRKKMNKRRLAIGAGAALGSLAALAAALAVMMNTYLPVPVTARDITSVRYEMVYGGDWSEPAAGEVNFCMEYRYSPHDIGHVTSGNDEKNPDGSVTRTVFFSEGCSVFAKLFVFSSSKRDRGSDGLTASTWIAQGVDAQADAARIHWRVYNVDIRDWKKFSSQWTKARGVVAENGELLPALAGLAQLVWEGTPAEISKVQGG